MRKLNLLLETIKSICNVRAILAVVLGVTFAVMAILGLVSPTEFQTVFMAIILYFFTDSSTTSGGGEK